MTMSKDKQNNQDVPLNNLNDKEANHEKTPPPLNINYYATKKSAAQSMLDVALLMANSSQLRTIINMGPRDNSFFIPLIVLLSLSITLQVLVGLLLIFIVQYDLNDKEKHAKLDRLNNAATIFVFFTVLINIFITAFGFQGHPSSTTPHFPMGMCRPPGARFDRNETRDLNQTHPFAF